MGIYNRTIRPEYSKYLTLKTMKNFCSITMLALAIFALATKDAEAQRFTNKKTYNSIGVHLNA